MKISPLYSRYLIDDNQKTFIAIGHNTCWPRWEQDENTVFAKYERFFRKMHENGANYTRIWLSAPFFEPEYEFGKFDDSRGQRARTVQELARKYDIKIKFCFCHYRNIQSDSISFPGSVPFGMPVWHQINGGCAISLGDFLITDDGKRDFIQRVEFWKRHLAADETVFAWELWNEMNCVNAIVPVWHQWTREMLEKVRAIFPGHLVTQSIGGYDSLDLRPTHEAVWQMPENDLIQIHLYMNPDSPPESIRSKPMDVMLSETIGKVNISANDRPLLFTETGAISFKQYAGPSDIYSLDREGTLFHDALFTPFFCGSAGSGHIWHWEIYVERFELYWHYRRFNTAIQGIDPVEERFTPVRLPNDRCRVYALIGNRTSLIWCRDAAMDYRTELIDGKEPELVKGKTLRLPRELAGDREVSFYEPWTDQHCKGKINSDRLELPDFKRSLVIRISK